MLSIFKDSRWSERDKVKVNHAFHHNEISREEEREKEEAWWPVFSLPFLTFRFPCLLSFSFPSFVPPFPFSCSQLLSFLFFGFLFLQTAPKSWCCMAVWFWLYLPQPNKFINVSQSPKYHLPHSFKNKLLHLRKEILKVTTKERNWIY